MIHSRLIKCLFLASPILTALAVYGYSIGLPFFWDDGPQFRLLETSNGLDVWLGNADYLYYRPAVFTLWKISAVLAGFYDAIGLHWLNIILFGISGVLLGKIAHSIIPNQKLFMALITGNGFILFPFSYQAITWIGSMFHTLLAVCLMLTVWCSLIWLQKRATWALILGVFSGFIGIFSHEIGVVIAVAVVMVWVFYITPPSTPSPQGGERAKKQTWLIFSPFLHLMGKGGRGDRGFIYITPLIISALVFVILYINVPRDTSPGRLQPIAEIIESSATMGQSLFYPFVALIRPLVDGVPPAVPMVISILGGLIALFGTIAILGRHTAYICLALLGLGWCMLMLTPSLLLLDQFYINGSPRLLLLPSLGISLMSGVASVVLMRWRVGQVIAVLFIGLSVLVATRFLNIQRDQFMMQNAYAQRLFTMVKSQDPIAKTVLVNAPDYITPLESDTTFLRGAEGAAFLVFTVNYADYISINTGVDLPHLQTVKYGILNQAVGYSMYPHDPEVDEITLQQIVYDADVVYVTQFNGRNITPVAVKLPVAGADTPLYRLGDALSITELSAVYLSNEMRLRVHIRWRVDNPQMLQAFVHVFCGAEKIGQVDAGPWGGAYPFHLWMMDDYQTDVREIPLSRPFIEGCMAVLGVYRPSDVSRLPIIDLQTGETLPNDQMIIPYWGESEDDLWILKP